MNDELTLSDTRGIFSRLKQETIRARIKVVPIEELLRMPRSPEQERLDALVREWTEQCIKDAYANPLTLTVQKARSAGGEFRLDFGALQLTTWSMT